MRWLLVKDLQILRRSPLLVGLLIVYPIAIALMIGFALSSPPGKPKVAFYSEVPTGKGKIAFGNQQINVSQYASQLFQAIQPIRVRSRDEAIAKVRDGEALAALIVPSDIPAQIQSLVTTGVGTPTVELYLNYAGSDRAPVRRTGDQVTPQRGRAGGVQAGAPTWPPATSSRCSTGAAFSSWARTSRCSGCATPGRSCRGRWLRCRRVRRCGQRFGR